jgi:hypothetical protein
VQHLFVLLYLLFERRRCFVGHDVESRVEVLERGVVRNAGGGLDQCVLDLH